MLKKPAHKFLYLLILVISIFVIYNGIVFYKKLEVTTFMPKETTFIEILENENEKSHWGYDARFKNSLKMNEALDNKIIDERLIDIVAYSKIVKISLNKEVINSIPIFEFNFSHGAYWLQKIASATSPVPVDFALYNYKNELLLVLWYSIESIQGQQTKDYYVVYKYDDISGEYLESFIKTKD